MVRAGQKRPVEFPVGDHAAHRDAAKADAVIAAFAADEACAAAFAVCAVIGDCHLERAVGGFRARIAEKDMVEIGGREGRDPARQLERLGMAELERGGEIEFARLGLDCAHDRFPAVPGIGAPQPRRPVQHRRPVRLEVVHVLCPYHHPGLAFELSVGREGQPEGFKIVRCRIGAHAQSPFKLSRLKVGAAAKASALPYDAFM